MATYRIGIGSFNLKDGAVGIGTESSGLGNLKVEGTIKTTDLDVTGVSTFTRYSGFEAEQTNIIRDASYGGNESVTYTVTVIGGIFYIDGVSAPILTLKRGTTYTFDQSADTNSNHPFRFKDGDGNSYPNGVTATGTAGSSGAKVTLVVASNAPDDLRYYCTVHGNGMGNTISVINQNSSNIQTTGDIVVDTGKTLTVGLGATISVGSVECISVKNHFSVPVGDTAGRNKSSGYAEGTVRYNRDLGTMEFFNGDEWRQFNYQSDGNRGRALNMSGSERNSPYYKQDISYINVQSKGNAVAFGDLTNGREGRAAFANEIRGMSSMGHPGPDDVIEYVTMASEGNSIDFGNLTVSRFRGSAVSSSTRGIVIGGRNPGNSNVMDYIEIMTLGNALDFGDLGTSGTRGSGHGSSATRAIIANKEIDFIMIASKGNSVEFGKDLFAGQYNQGGGSTGTRAVWAGGYGGPTSSPYAYHMKTTSIRGVNIESGGLAVEYGNLVSNRGSTGAAYNYNTGTSDRTRAVWMGGYQIDPNQHVNNIDFFTMNSTGFAQDFGDLMREISSNTSCCDSHGGLGGF